MRTRIKICGFTREADIDDALEAGADALGLNLYPKSPRAVSAERAAELAARIDVRGEINGDLGEALEEIKNGSVKVADIVGEITTSSNERMYL